MLEIKGNLFDQKCDAICITTNGVVIERGELVMGAGCALEAKKRWPGLPFILGDLVLLNGNIPHIIKGNHLGCHDYDIISFPTKSHWKCASRLLLIKESCELLMDIVRAENLKKVVLPRPGCGLGGLVWSEVKKAIKPLLDDRVCIISND